MANHGFRFRPHDEKRKILLIEDEAINQALLQQYLTDIYQVIPAMTGSEALEILQSGYETLSLILLDLNLPDIHGLDLLRRIQQDVRFARLPVIVMTADSEAEVECLSLGAIDFIPKPYPGPAVVRARVLRTIELSEDRNILTWTERDQLTGLYNRDFFYHYASLLDTYHPEDSTDAVLININHFHNLNERYGKAYGDEVLRRIGRQMLEILGESGGIAGRGEGDNFLLYLPHREDYRPLLDRLSGVTDQQAGTRIRLRLGVYSQVDKSLEIERRFDRAKMAADTVRSNFLNSVGLYNDSMHKAEIFSEQLIESFPAAIREKQFMVCFQPKFAVQGDQPVLASAEALVRWYHPTLGLLGPGTFIPLFEDNGLIRDLDHYVWASVAESIRAWKEKYGITIPVSVNVSRIDLFDPQIIDILQDLISRNRLDYHDLPLEVTESAYTEDADQIVEKVGQLRKLGFRIEMDDFGSGYSSLNMLSILPIDALKLDMAFIRHAFSAESPQGRDTRLLQAMIHLAKSFEVPTIAEGVETAEQYSVLRTMGCDYIQGYYFSRPLPPGEFEQFILAHSPAGSVKS